MYNKLAKNADEQHLYKVAEIVRLAADRISELEAALGKSTVDLVNESRAEFFAFQQRHAEEVRVLKQQLTASQAECERLREELVR